MVTTRPVPDDIFRVNVNWDLKLGSAPAAEQGLFSFHGQRHHFVGNSTNDAAACQTIANKVRDAYHSTIGQLSYFGNAVSMSHVDVYKLAAANGKATDKGTALFEGDTATTGNATKSMPWESCLVVELFAYDPAGYDAHRRRKRGRIFLPLMSPDILDSTGNGEFSQGSLTFLVNGVQAFFNSVEGVPLGSGAVNQQADFLRVGVLSRTFNEFNGLVAIQCSTKFHHQRRREHKEGNTLATASISF